MKPIYVISGIVVAGQKRGRILGFPTANVVLHTVIPEGIYTSEVTVDGETYMAASFVGIAGTFGEKDYKLETYLLDFAGDIYGHVITVKLYEKIRENQKFDSEASLISQMKEDVAMTRKFFASRHTT